MTNSKQASSLTRRQLIQGGIGALALGAALPAAAQSPVPIWTPLSPLLGAPAPPEGLSGVSKVLHGVGVYIGNDWYTWDDDARRFAMARVRAWGFDFVCPKVGGYGRTYYRDAEQLRGWSDSAHGIGLGFAPFIYSVPSSFAADAHICAQIAQVCGIANVDMEDEWGAPGDHAADMADFGRRYRDEAGTLPIIVNGYGDPITRFGAGGFPATEAASWADAYSPQWYVGQYARYRKGGVAAALDWGRAEVLQAFGPSVGITPSISIESASAPNSKIPLPDLLTLMAQMRTYGTPIFVWEYGMIDPATAEALLGPPAVQGVRLGRSRPTDVSVQWTTHVPARSVLTWSGPDGAAHVVRGTSLDLSHSATADGLAPGTVYSVKVQAESGGGSSAPFPLTAATAPATPGLYVQSALATKDGAGKVVVTATVVNSSDTPIADVRVLQASLGGVPQLVQMPILLGSLGPRDWEASARDRAAFTLVAPLPAGTAKASLRVAGTSGTGAAWSAVLPITIQG